MRAAVCLLATHLHYSIVVARQEQSLYLARALGVHPLADNEGRRLLVDTKPP